jgi:6-pyruvoyltetrahydropterin/6-carboxytetrahydropterin synthase
MFEITKEHGFSASHVLAGLADGHPCSRLHGHNYLIRVSVTAPKLDGHGFVLDYHDLAPFIEWVDAHLDHQHLNEVLPDMQSSAENLARHLTLVARDLLVLPAAGHVSVAVSETPKTWATWIG